YYWKSSPLGLLNFGSGLDLLRGGFYMGAFSGTNDHVTNGNVGVAIIAGVGGDLAFQDFATDATGDLKGYLTIGGDLSKQTIDLGALPANEGTFNISFPGDTDISFFDTVVVAVGETSVGSARVP
ncbi:MAG: hypothetical protein KTR27_11990, partial [Leptolyngbyaceae cyanobacterium MAG.088]|nr:hypothetical protein [Leptolyngbyaceae cyanobacterium MAG.088]